MLVGISATNSLNAISNTDLKEVDSIIDKLEQKLLNDESKSVFFGAQKNSLKNRKTDSSIRYVEEAIKGSLPQKNDLNEISKVISSIENDVNKMNGEVEALKMRIESNANPPSLVELSVGVEKADVLNFRELKIEINGHTIYQLNHGDGLWMPTNRLSLFKGPMEPGKYAVKIKSRVVKKTDKPPFVDSNIFQIIDQVKEINIPEGTFKKGYSFIFKDFDKQNQNATIDLAEYDL